MGEHRLYRPKGRPLIDTRQWIHFGLAALLTVGGSLLIGVLINWVAAVLVGGLGAANILAEISWARDHARDKRDLERQWARIKQEWARLDEEYQAAKANARRAVDLLATQPGGAPLVADVAAHCGCVHRWMFNGENGWALVEITTPGPGCPVAATSELQEVPG